KLPAVGETSVHVYGLPGTSAATSSVTVSLLKNADGTIVEETGELIKDTNSFPGRTTGSVKLTFQEDGGEPVPLAPGDLLYVRNKEPEDAPGILAAPAASIASDPRIP